ncbi:MAG TPA: glycosyltransferase family 39 protein, partial [Chloroflexota bacterium]|nr:glycosyltransferase family 39 protein [Chloroflexota bacterium]
LLAVALALRVYQYDWDQGHLYHPDERFILMSSAAITLSWPPDLTTLSTPSSSLIPQDYSFSYGTLSLYLVRVVQAFLVQLNHLIPSLHFLDEVNDLGFLRTVGRPISALFDTGTVYLVYRLGRLLYGKRVAFLAAIFVTFSVIDLQLSHFYATDTIMTALVIAAIASSASYLQSGRIRWAVWAGVFAGLALATKASAATVFAPVVIAHVLRLFLRDDAVGTLRIKDVSASDVSRAATVGVFSVAAGALAFVVAEPFAIIDFSRFITGVLEQSSMVRGIADLPYTRQYFNRPAYLYFLQNLVVFGTGAPLGIAMIVGFLAMCFRNIRRPRVGELLLLSYVVPYFAITGDFWAKFLRYMLPISPLLCLMAALLLVQLVDVLRGWRHTASIGSPGESDIEAGTIRLPPELVIESYGEQFDVTDLTVFDGEAVEVSSPLAASLVSFESQPVFTSAVAVGASDSEQALTPTSTRVEVGVANGKNGSADVF